MDFELRPFGDVQSHVGYRNILIFASLQHWAHQLPERLIWLVAGPETPKL